MKMVIYKSEKFLQGKVVKEGKEYEFKKINQYYEDWDGPLGKGAELLFERERLILPPKKELIFSDELFLNPQTKEYEFMPEGGISSEEAQNLRKKGYIFVNTYFNLQ